MDQIEDNNSASFVSRPRSSRAMKPLAPNPSSGSRGKPTSIPTDEHSDFEPQDVPAYAVAALDQIAEASGGEFKDDPRYIGSVARTTFDLPNSKDNLVTLVFPATGISALPTQSLVEIRSINDNLIYLGVVVEGPFAEPDGLRADSPIVVTIGVQGMMYMPPYHGRVQVELLGEKTKNGLVPPRFRPLPNSPVFALSEEETAAALKIMPIGQSIPIGWAVGHKALEVNIPATKMDVLPRHTAVLGTTGGGKSTTVSGLIRGLQQTGTAVVLIDTEGEYTMMNEPTQDPKMLELLRQRDIEPGGVEQTVLYHLVGREPANRHHGRLQAFSLPFEQLSPYMVSEILELNEPQDHRFRYAYDLTKRMMADLKVYPANKKDEEALFEVDEMERGYPKMRLSQLYSVVHNCARKTNRGEEIVFTNQDFIDPTAAKVSFEKFAKDMPGSFPSWLAVLGRLGRLNRLGIFDVTRDKNRDGASVAPLSFALLTRPGMVSIVDLSGTDSPQINNLVIAELLRGVHEQQDINYKSYEDKKGALRRTVVVIEEAHEFLSRERIKQMPVLFQQVARIARRGRKRWLGLMFVTQLPQHLPDEVLGLVNNFILHKISDDGVISRLQRTVSGIDRSLWGKLSGLAAGQAIVSVTSFARPLLVSVHPTPCRLRMIERDDEERSEL